MVVLWKFSSRRAFRKECKPVRVKESICRTKKWLYFGSLAQLGEHLPYKQRVTGSSPVTSIQYSYSNRVLWNRGLGTFFYAEKENEWYRTEGDGMDEFEREWVSFSKTG